MPRKLKPDDGERRAQVQQLYFQGYTIKEIIDKLQKPRRLIQDDVQRLRMNLERREIKKIEYRKNKILAKITLLQRTAWGILDDCRKRKPTLALTAGRLINSSHELEAKVEGVIAEKIVGGPDKAMSDLMKELRQIETKSLEADKDTKPTVVETNETPEFPPELNAILSGSKGNAQLASQEKSL